MRQKYSSDEQSQFTRETLLQIAKDVKRPHYNGVRRVNVSDDVGPGLRAIIQPDGRVSLHAHYAVGESRPQMFIGQISDPKAPDYIEIDDARKITKTIRALGDKGVDPQEGLHTRLLKELMRDGTNWRPALAPAPTKTK